MPIKNLITPSDERLPRIAKLYKGGKKREKTKNGKTYEIFGEDLDHFRIEFEAQFEHLKPLWVEMYGEEPSYFERVYLTAPTADEALAYWYEDYNTSGTLLHRCDGDDQVLWFNTDIGKHSTAKMPCAKKCGQTCACKPTGRIDLLLPDFIDAAGVLGVVSVTTHSLNDIIDNITYLRMVQSTYGRLIGIPFNFGRAPRPVSAPKNKDNPAERIKTTKSLIYLYVDPDAMRSRILPLLTGMFDTPQLTATSAPQLPETVEEQPEEIISTETARKALGNGGSRRLGADQPKAESTETAEDEAHWTSDAKAVSGFFKWCKDKLDMAQGEVFAALSVSHGAIASLADWTFSKEMALASVIAAHCAYDEDCIEDFTASQQNTGLKEEINFNLFDMACNISEQRREALAEVEQP